MLEWRTRQALAPRERVAAGAVSVYAGGVEALAHEFGVVGDEVGVSRVKGALDVEGGRGAGAGVGGVCVG